MNLTAPGGFLLAYFTPDPGDGEQVRLAVSEGARPDRFRILAGGQPVVRSTVGERGLRDPFLARDSETGGAVLLATDLRVQDSDDWQRTTRRGSRSIAVSRSADLVSWSEPELIEVAPPSAGNAWAPKAFRSPADDEWQVFWASALYDEGPRDAGSHQRILVAHSPDLRTFSPASTYLDLGHDVIDVTFAAHDGHMLRFSANAQSADPHKEVGFHIFLERGNDLLDPAYLPVAVDVGKPELVRGEGPAVAVSADGAEVYLLIDEFCGRGYTLFSSTDPVAHGFRWEPDAELPPHARHGSLLAVTDIERRRLLAALG